MKKLLTKKEFRALAGISASNLNTYIERGKIVMQGNLIDDTNEVNRRFLEKRANRKPNQDFDLHWLDKLESELTQTGLYDVNFEEIVGKLNKQLQGQNKTIPAGLVDNLGLGLFIEFSKAIYLHESNFRSKNILPAENISSFYEEQIRKYFAEFKEAVKQTIQEIEEES